MSNELRATVDATYQARLDDLIAQAAAQWTALTGEGTRPWQHPTQDSSGTPRAVHDIERLGAGFDRGELNDAYLAATRDVEEAGTTGDVIALKLQIGELAAMEQGHRFRHMSLARALVHGGARRYGHGHGPIMSRVSREIADLIAAGHRPQEAT